MNSELQEKYQEWLESPYFDEKTKEELRSLEGNDKEIEERFYKDLEFGTGGMRGLMGAGTNRLNIYTVRRAANGLAEYIVITVKKWQTRQHLFSMRMDSKPGCLIL